jgi:hypothetical protein
MLYPKQDWYRQARQFNIYALSAANEIGSQGVLIHFQEYYQIPHLSILLIA